MNKELFVKYAELKLQEKEIKAQLEALNPQVLEELRVHGDVPVDTALGSFIVTNRKTWTYSVIVQTLSSALKEKQAEEQATGSATFETERTLMFKGLTSKL